MIRRDFLASSLGLMAASAMGCGASREMRTLGVFRLAISDKTAPAFSQGDVTLFQVTTAIQVPLLDKPKDLGAKQPGYPSPYWLESKNLQLQLSYAIHSLDPKPVTVELMLDGWNEFIRYTPTLTVNEEGEVNADKSTVDRLIIVPPKGRVEGRISYDDFERMARALAILLNDKIPNAAHIVEPSTNLQKSPLAAPYLPSTINAVTGFDFSMRLAQARPILVEATLEIVDIEGPHLVDLGEKTKWRPPRRWSPPPPREAT